MSSADQATKLRNDDSGLTENTWERLCFEQQQEIEQIRLELRESSHDRDEALARNEVLEGSVDVLEERVQELEDAMEDLEDEKEDLEEEILEFEAPSSRRPPPHFKLPDERSSVTHKFHIGNSELGCGYITCSTYPDSNDLGEIFIKMHKQGEPNLPPHLASDPYVTQMHHDVTELTAFLRGVLDQLAIAVSVGLQRGLPLESYASKYRGTRFPPDGMTRNQDIPFANSIVDYLFRWMGMKFIGTEEWLPPKRGH